MLENLEQARMNKTLYESMRKGTDLLKKVNQALTIEDVTKLLDENAEAMEYQ
jgi:hypothetical protein